MGLFDFLANNRRMKLSIVKLHVSVLPTEPFRLGQLRENMLERYRRLLYAKAESKLRYLQLGFLKGCSECLSTQAVL